MLGRCRTLGYPVRGGNAVCRVFEAGRTVEARYWIGSEDPSVETYTGELVRSLADGTTVPPADVGPVTWLEGRPPDQHR
ncbi:MAG TPA: hypothetical protein VFX16_28585 [Pseudonocardiaceae bacterium]|nr:hypothetical protein [Pseudonocardiaceae bacterium]